MSPSEARKKAEKFLRGQAEIMKQYGKAPKLSGPTYRAAINETAKTLRALTTSDKAD